MTMPTFTTAECAQRLPRVLVEYLWRLAAESGADVQTFILSTQYVGVNDVQDILYRRDGFSSWRRVFGFEPVEATVEVRITEAGAIMSLKEENEVHDIAGEEEMVCSA